jgi:predicted amidophosphoribosyltransferase
VDVAHTEGKKVLLVDDLYRSGATLNAITDLLLTEGKAASVSVLTITRTRSNQ